MKLKNSNCDETQLKLWSNSNCNQTQKSKLWWHSKTQIVMKLKNSNCDETQNLKLLLNSKSQIVMKFKNSIYDETQKLKVLRDLVQNKLSRSKWVITGAPDSPRTLRKNMYYPFGVRFDITYFRKAQSLTGMDL